MINLDHVYPLTDFKRNAKEFIDRIKAAKTPFVLTVNGKAEIVVQDASAFQEMVDRLQQAEEELRHLKLEALRQEVAIGLSNSKTVSTLTMMMIRFPLCWKTSKLEGGKTSGGILIYEPL